MCLAIPAKVIRISDAHAEVDIMGLRKNINILLVDNLSIGDNVMVHAGYAINKIDEAYFDFLQNTLNEMLGEKP
jgi:hydrogenase assembly chaperone HypC/HupF